MSVELVKFGNRWSGNQAVVEGMQQVMQNHPDGVIVLWNKDSEWFMNYSEMNAADMALVGAILTANALKIQNGDA